MIRAYRPADCEAVLAVWARASAVAHAFLSPDFLAQECIDIRERYLPNAETWVWEEGGAVAGFVSLVGSEVGGLFVDPTCQRRGIGRALIEQARARRGALDVEVFELNGQGRAFYAALGFVIAARSIHEATGFVLVRMRLEGGENNGQWSTVNCQWGREKIIVDG